MNHTPISKYALIIVLIIWPRCIPKTVSTKTIHSLELLHLDTCGSISVPSLNGERHCLSIVDVYIRWTSIVPVMSKDQTSIEIERFILFAENHFHSTGFAVGKVRSNNGGEFCNKELDGYFWKKKGLFTNLRYPSILIRMGLLRESIGPSKRKPEYFYQILASTMRYIKYIIKSRHGSIP